MDCQVNPLYSRTCSSWSALTRSVRPPRSSLSIPFSSESAWCIEQLTTNTVLASIVLTTTMHPLLRTPINYVSLLPCTLFATTNYYCVFATRFDSLLVCTLCSLRLATTLYSVHYDLLLLRTRYSLHLTTTACKLLNYRVFAFAITYCCFWAKLKHLTS